VITCAEIPGSDSTCAFDRQLSVGVRNGVHDESVVAGVGAGAGEIQQPTGVGDGTRGQVGRIGVRLRNGRPRAEKPDTRLGTVAFGPRRLLLKRVERLQIPVVTVHVDNSGTATDKS